MHLLQCKQSSRPRASSPRPRLASPLERVKFFKLAWDAIGSEFGSRHLQYEIFYSGPSFVTRGHAFRFFDWDGARGLVEDFMAGYGLPDVTVIGARLPGFNGKVSS